MGILLLAGMTRAAPAADVGSGVPLRISDRRAHDVEVTRPEPGVVEIRTSGPDPYVLAEIAGPGFDPAATSVLDVEYFSPTGTDALEVFPHPLPRPVASESGPGLSVAQGWTRHAVDLRRVLARSAGPIRGVRIDLGTKPGRTVRIRSITLRPRTEGEQRAEATRDAKRASDAALDARLAAYLAQTFPAAVTRVSADDQQIRIEGTLGRPPAGELLAEVPLWADATALAQPPALLLPIAGGADGRFSLSIDRRTALDGRPHDRLRSRWAVVRRDGAGLTPLSAARWVDDVKPPADVPPAVKPRTKKGLGGFQAGRLDGDLDELGISAVTVNVQVSSLLRTAGGAGRTPVDLAGRTWWTEDRAVGHLDRTLLAAAGRGAVVSAIVLVPPPRDADPASYARLVAHPDADPAGIYAMPNLATRDGCEAYAAALEFLARRYGRAGGSHGRIHHYVLHNEVDAGWTWTNAGEKPIRAYLDLYHRSMRAAHLTARQYDPAAKAFVSLTHHWAEAGGARYYAGRDVLDVLLDFSRAEGDFDWAIAHHPYPQSLFNPRTWADDQATFSFDAPKVTFRNIEVLDAWVRRPRAMYLDRHVRTIHLTEQGLNSKDYSEAALRDQAAGMAYAWNKVKHLDSIEAFQYHNWVDHRGEGGLRIGLRRFPDDGHDPLGKKPIWHVYQALGTDREEAATAPYLRVVGVNAWDEVRHREPIR